MLPTVGGLALRVANDLTQRMEQVVNGGDSAPPLDLSEIGVWQGQERITVLLLGIDQRPGEDPNSARADTLILLTLDPLERTAGILSIPRDLYVPLPDAGKIASTQRTSTADQSTQCARWNTTSASRSITTRA